MKESNPVGWFEIYVNDISRAKKFYEKVLDIQLSDLPKPSTLTYELKMMAFPMDMNGAGASGALVEMKGFKAGANSTIVYFNSEDCSIEEKRIVEAGGRVSKSKQSIGEFGFMVLALDSEGNLFGVHSMK